MPSNPAAPLIHLVAGTLDGEFLFRSWREARVLWRMIWRAFPEADSACLMPDHFHLPGRFLDASARLAALESGFARWRAHHRGVAPAPLFQPHPAPSLIADKLHLRRTNRYVHLNPTRAKFVSDPLEWPFSTHRDMVGLAAPSVVARARDAAEFHRYVSSDPSVSVSGTPMPMPVHGRIPVEDLEIAVLSVMRALPGELRERGAVRTAFVRAGVLASTAEIGEIAERAGVGRDAVYLVRNRLPTSPHVLPPSDPVRVAMAVAQDRRFIALEDGDLRHHPRWRRLFVPQRWGPAEDGEG